MQAKIITLPGDGIGPEVVAQGVRVLDKVAATSGHHFEFHEHLIGGWTAEQADVAVERGEIVTGVPGEIRGLEIRLRGLADCRECQRNDECESEEGLLHKLAGE